MASDDRLQDQLRQLRTLVQDLGWSGFMGHVTGLMAEQSDRADDENQAAILYASSNTLRALGQIWVGCGRFKYPPEMVNPEPEEPDGE